MYSTAAKFKTSGKSQLHAKIYLRQHMPQKRVKVPKKGIFCTCCIIGIVCFRWGRAAVVHLTRVIKGGSVETSGALNASPAALQRKTVEFLVPALLPLELDPLMATGDQEQCCLMATMNPLKVYIGAFCSSFIHFPSFKRISWTEIHKPVKDDITSCLEFVSFSMAG